MKIKVCYENQCQYLDLNEKETEQLWVQFSLESGEEVTQDQKEEMIQEAFNKEFNRPDYNNWHKHDRHIGYGKDESGEILIEEAANPDLFFQEENERKESEDYEAYCQIIRGALKEIYAETIIAVHLDGMTCMEYAMLTGENSNTINHRLHRAEKKLKEYFEKVL